MRSRSSFNASTTNSSLESHSALSSSMSIASMIVKSTQQDKDGQTASLESYAGTITLSHAVLTSPKGIIFIASSCVCLLVLTYFVFVRQVASSGLAIEVSSVQSCHPIITHSLPPNSSSFGQTVFLDVFYMKTHLAGRFLPTIATNDLSICPEDDSFVS